MYAIGKPVVGAIRRVIRKAYRTGVDTSDHPLQMPQILGPPVRVSAARGARSGGWWRDECHPCRTFESSKMHQLGQVAVGLTSGCLHYAGPPAKASGVFAAHHDENVRRTCPEEVTECCNGFGGGLVWGGVIGDRYPAVAKDRAHQARPTRSSETHGASQQSKPERPRLRETIHIPTEGGALHDFGGQRRVQSAHRPVASTAMDK